MMMMHMMITKLPAWGEFEKVMLGKRRDFYDAAMQLVVDDIVRGIEGQRDITGSRFPPLSPVTVALKGHDKALIHRGLLVDPWTYECANQWRVDKGEITIKPRQSSVEAEYDQSTGKRSRGSKGSAKDQPRDQVGYRLQEVGVNGKYFRFFGISKDAEAQILALMDQLVIEALNAI